jgi:thiol:disulfide interchange protein DsbC
MKFLKLAASAALMSFAVNAAAQDADELRQRLSLFLGPDFPVSAVEETPLPGIFEVIAGNRVLYVGIKDEFVLIGNLFDTAQGVNVGEQKQNEVARNIAKQEIGESPVEDMVVFKGDETRRHITVFTDVECGYCRRLHLEVPELNAAGIEVRYLLFPVLTQNSMPNAESVWCAEDQQTAMTDAKLGKAIEQLSCDNPIADQLEIGRKMGVRGTPFIVLDDYSVLPGYVPAADLIARMGLE